MKKCAIVLMIIGLSGLLFLMINGWVARQKENTLKKEVWTMVKEDRSLDTRYDRETVIKYCRDQKAEHWREFSGFAQQRYYEIYKYINDPEFNKIVVGRKNSKTAILERAQDCRIIMFGEWHGSYRDDNDFFIDLLPELKAKGYGYLALEISDNPQTEIAKIIYAYIKGYIKRDDLGEMWSNFIAIKINGWLDLIDRAKNLDIKIICYDYEEPPGEARDINYRDRTAFRNLKKFFDSEKKKIIVYCGEMHISRKPVLYEGKKLYLLGSYLDMDNKNDLLTVSLIPVFLREDSKNPKTQSSFCDIIVNIDKEVFTETYWQNHPLE